MHKLQKHSSHSAPYKPHGVGTRKQFFCSKSKKPKRFMIFEPQNKGRGSFSDPPPTPTCLKSSKKWVSGKGDLGVSGPKTHWGMHLLDNVMSLQRVIPTIQPLGVGYANRPQKAQNGGLCGVFPYIRAFQPPTTSPR